MADGLVLIGDVLVDQSRDDEAAVKWQRAIIWRAVNEDHADALAVRMDALKRPVPPR